MDDLTIHDGCGNVFRDMGMADADERLANALRLREIRLRTQSGGLSAADAAALAGCSEDEITEALRPRFSRASSERLARVAQSIGVP